MKLCSLIKAGSWETKTEMEARTGLSNLNHKLRINYRLNRIWCVSEIYNHSNSYLFAYLHFYIRGLIVKIHFCGVLNLFLFIYKLFCTVYKFSMVPKFWDWFYSFLIIASSFLVSGLFYVSSRSQINALYLVQFLPCLYVFLPSICLVFLVYFLCHSVLWNWDSIFTEVISLYLKNVANFSKLIEMNNTIVNN